MRIGAFGLLIFYHVGMLYVSWGFHIKSAHRITALEPLMLVLNPWRLSLLFLVSGVATRFMLRKYTLAPLLRSRTARLLIPLLFGMLVIVPPQAYDQIVEALGYPAGFVDFYLNALFRLRQQFCPNPCIILPTWNHLWFVVYLWVYTMALGLVLIAVPGVAGWIERWLAPLCLAVAIDRAVAGVCGLPAVAAAELSIDACAVWRLVQSRAVCHRVPARLPARACRIVLGGDRAPALDRAVARGCVLRSLPHLRSVRDGGMPIRSLHRRSPTASISGSAWSSCSALRGAG